MKYLYLLAIVILILSCSGSDESGSSVQHVIESDQDSTKNDSLSGGMINCDSPDSILSAYKRIRMLTASVEEFTEFTISGSVFWKKEGLWIVNLEEKWDQYNFPFSIVIGATNNFDEQFDDERAVYLEIGTFLSERMTVKYQLFNGNFRAFDYNNKGYNGVILENLTSHRTDYNGFEQLYFIKENRLEATKVIANTRCIIGECEDLDGIREKIKLGSESGAIHVSRIENHLGECLLDIGVRYDKIWNEPEQMLSSLFPNKFNFDFVKEDSFKEIPLKFYGLTIYEGDTIQNFMTMEIDVHHYSSGDAWADLEETGMHDYAESLIVYFQHYNSHFEIYTRMSGYLDNETDRTPETLYSNESKMQMSRFIFTPTSTNSEVYHVKSEYIDSYWTIKDGKYPMEEIEEGY